MHARKIDVAIAALSAGLLYSGTFAGDAPRPLTAVMPMAQATRTATAPVIDGCIDDEVWQNAVLIDDLRQVLPNEGAEPSERTEVRVLFDDDTIYFGFRCFDREPDKITATEMRHDGALIGDDRVGIVIDTNYDRRNAYYFDVNPVGGRRDAVIENNENIRFDWDAIWIAKATIDDEGWQAEIAIPTRSINFDPESDRWGFNITRSIVRRNETIRWASPVHNRRIIHVDSAGDLTGLERLDQGIGLDIKPYVTTRFRDHAARDSRFELDGGLDLFYNLTPSLKAAITINTDFAETEVDERRANLTRFPLFFPEKRDFFLQDAGIFNFGGGSLPLPFFSRTIGLGVDGRPVRIVAGAKLTGRVDDLNIGLLDIEQDAHAGVPSSNLAAGRVSLNVLDESEVGLIFTNGDPFSGRSNAVVGADFNYRTRNLPDDRLLLANARVLRSFSSGENATNETALSLSASYPNDTWSWIMGYDQVGDDFRAAMGFVPRVGYRKYYGLLRRRIRPEIASIRRVDFTSFSHYWTNFDDEMESADFNASALVESEIGDLYILGYRHEQQQLNSAFPIAANVTLNPGRYKWNYMTLSYYGAASRPLRFGVSTNAGTFWSGHRWGVSASLDWEPSSHLSFTLEYDLNEISLPEGDFQTHIALGRINVYFTPDIAWTNLVQYDSVSESLGIHSRLHWTVRPGNDVYLVVNQGLDTSDAHWRSVSTEVVTKTGMTLRF